MSMPVSSRRAQERARTRAERRVSLGRRVSTTTLEGTTRHVYDNNWQVIADIDEQGNVVASYTWGAGIDNLLVVNVSGATYYPLTDIQGTVWGYVDSQNNVVARWQYEAWGNVVDEEIFVPTLASLRYRFQGREWSAATGLINFRMRWYDTETGRWLSKDPIGLSGELNLYAFCGNLVLLSTDPFGCKVYYDDGNGGHASLFVDDPDSKGQVRTFDFAPETGGWKNPTLNCLYGPGIATSHRQQKPSSYTACIDTDDDQDRAVIKEIDHFVKRKPNYGVATHNCVHAINEVLEAAGIYIPYCLPTPSGLADAIRDRRPLIQKAIDAQGEHLMNCMRNNPFFGPLR